MMRILKAGALYFALVMAAGFVLGTIRVFWIVPHFGERAAELMETPLMAVVIVFAARWTVRSLAVPPATVARLGVGFTALVFLLIAEFTVALRLRGLTLHQYFANRDPVAGTVYAVMLGVFAIMPLFVARK